MTQSLRARHKALRPWESENLETPGGRRALRKAAGELSTLDDVASMKEYVSAKAKEVWGDPQDWPKSITDTVATLDERQRTLTSVAAPAKTKRDTVQRVHDSVASQPATSSSRHARQVPDPAPPTVPVTTVDAPAQTRPARAEPAPPPVASPADTRSWNDLGDYAANFPVRGVGDPPHPTMEHLRQRIGDRQRGVRKKLRARRLLNGRLTVEDVTAVNHTGLLEAAHATQWGNLSVEDLAKVRQLALQWEPLVTDQARLTSLAETMADTWMGKLRFDSTDFPNGKGAPALSKLSPELKSACRNLIETVEQGVLDEVGLPDIVVHGLTMDRPYYDEKTFEIHIPQTKFNDAQIQHEFGHHIEEQGPVEVWCGLSSYLGRISLTNEPLQKPLVDKSAPVYAWDWSKAQPRLPQAGYAISYYPDAATELLAVGLEVGAPADFKSDFQTFKTDSELPKDPNYTALLMQAVRPNQARQAGLPVPTLLSPPPANQ